MALNWNEFNVVPPAVEDPTGRFAQPRELAANGRRPCRWCHGPLPKGRSSWCSNDCVQSYLMRKTWKYAARAVLNRDKGRCQICGIDLKRLKALLRETRGRGYAFARWVLMWFDLMNRREVYDIDHIVPRWRGGTNHPSNLRTLCVCCHKRVTRLQAAERASEKRKATNRGCLQ